MQPLKHAQLNPSANASGSWAKRPLSYHSIAEHPVFGGELANSGASREKSPASSPRTASSNGTLVFIGCGAASDYTGRSVRPRCGGKNAFVVTSRSSFSLRKSARSLGQSFIGTGGFEQKATKDRRGLGALCCLCSLL